MTESSRDRIYLSPPHMSDSEETFFRDAFASNWIAPLGPHVDAFESEFAAVVASRHAVALSSGTAALHLALLCAGVHAGDHVLVSDLTFVASANAIKYLGAKPVLIDAEPASWNLDAELVAVYLDEQARRGRLPAAVVVVHLYGQTANLGALLAVCGRYDVPLIEDAAEALGATYGGRSPGTFGRCGVFSFNGNKIITTSGGGMLVTDDAEFATRVRKLSMQAREPAPHYEHCEIGYNYRLSNLLAAVGRGQLKVLEDRVRARRRNFGYYQAHLADLPGISFQPEAPWGRHSRWLTTLVIEPEFFGADREVVRVALEAENIEARPLWKPMHLQPAYHGCHVLGGAVAEGLFEKGLCLPSGSAMTEADLSRVVDVVRACSEAHTRTTKRPLALSGL